MKNKKGLSETILKGIIIILFIIAIVLLWGVTQDIIKPQFPITKEVCEENIIQRDFNESFAYFKFYEYQKDESSDVYDKCKSLEGKLKIDCEKYFEEELKIIILNWKNGTTLSNIIYETKTTCEQVEVDELPVGYLSSDLGMPSCKFIVKKIIGNIMDYGLLDKGEGICATISKEDLTTEWLNENAKCVEYFNKKIGFLEKEKFDYYKEFCWSYEGDNYDGCDILKNYETKCSKYKYENYTIILE